MKFLNYEKQYPVNRGISSMWDEIHSIAGYSNIIVNNIYKADEDTKYFTFSFIKNRYLRSPLVEISGKAYSNNDSLTTIYIKTKSFLNIFFVLPVLFFIIMKMDIAMNIVLNAAIKILLITGITFGFIYICDREAKISIDGFISKLNIVNDAVDKRFTEH